MYMSAGVYTREVDFSAYVGRTSSTIVGMVGGATRGNVRQATLCTSTTDFLNKFGDPPANDFGAISALQFLKRGNQLYYTRAAGISVSNSTLALSGRTSADTVVPAVLTIRAQTPGTYGNQLSVTVTNVEQMMFTLSVFHKGVLSETLLLSLDVNSDFSVTRAKSIWLNFTLNLQTAVRLSTVATPQVLTGGTDGLPLTATDIINALNEYRNSDIIDINLLLAPGRFERTVVTEMINICETRGDCLAIIDPPQALNVADVISYHNGLLAGTNMPVTNLNSSYAALYYPWVRVFNAVSNVEEWIPPSGVVAAAYANNDATGQIWFAPAGLNRTSLSGLILDVETKLSEGDRNALYGGLNCVNPISNYKNLGVSIWGQKTLHRRLSAVNRINVRRLVSMIRKAIAASTAYITFEQNDSFTWNQWKGMVIPYLEDIKNNRGLYDYIVIMDETTVTPFHMDSGTMPGKVGIQPTRTAEFIEINFVLSSSGAEFGS